MRSWEWVSDLDETELDEAELTRPEAPGSKRAIRSANERLERGTAVGRYIVLDVLGEGGMGVVYRAFDPELDRKVAIKLLQARPGADQAWLIREAQAMARLSHPNVIAVHDVGSLPGDRVFVAMELVDGMTLREWLKSRRPWREVLQKMLAAGAGLAAAHAAGLVHRDFKPDNVLVGNDGRVRVMDFGLARLSDPGAVDAPDQDSVTTHSPLLASLTIAGTVAGTLPYMAPELREGIPADARSDQFSFGVALYEALFGARPFAKSAPAGTKAPLPSDTRVPARIQRVVMRALALNPDDRFRTIDELLGELAVDVGVTRRRALIAAAAVVSLGIAVVVGFTLSRSRDDLCTGIDTRLAGTWDAATKLGVRRAFDATKRPFAGAAFTALEHALDSYADDWITTAVDSCKATRVRGEQTEEVLSLRQSCLDRRLDELRALTQLLANADGELVDKGDKVVAGLEPVSRCANAEALRAPGLPPTEPKAKVDELNKHLADTKAQLLAGHYLATITAAKKSVVLADELHYAPYKAEALALQGAALAGGGNADEAAAVCTQAVWVALAGHRDDVVAAAALVAAAMTAVEPRVNEARIWLGLAKSMIERIGRDHWFELRTLEVEGLVAAAGGDTAAAIDAQLNAIAAAERASGPNNPDLWLMEEVIGITLAKSGAYDKARPHFERALALHEPRVGPDHPDIAVILTNLGICYSHAGDGAQARATYERVIAIHERADGPQNPILVLTLNNMADALIKSRDITGALYALDRAKSLADKSLGPGNPLTHAVGTTRAEALAAAGRVDEARVQYDQVIALELEFRSPYLGNGLSSRGGLELAAKQWAAAVSFEQRAIAAFEATGGKDAAELWQPLTGLARANIALGKPATARPLLERAIVIGEKAQLSPADLAPTRTLLEQLDRPRP